MRRICIFAVTLKTEDYSFFVSLRQKQRPLFMRRPSDRQNIDRRFPIYPSRFFRAEGSFARIVPTIEHASSFGHSPQVATPFLHAH